MVLLEQNFSKAIFPYINTGLKFRSDRLTCVLPCCYWSVIGGFWSMDNESIDFSKSGLFDFVFMQPLLEGTPLKSW